jgi:pyruvate dehydrogenase E1 component alpha subunit
MTPGKKKPAAPPVDEGFSLIPNERLLALYAAMLQCRMLLQRMRVVGGGTLRSSSADSRREAIAAGIVVGLLADDALSAPRGDIAPGLLKGLLLKRIFAAVVAEGCNVAAAWPAGETRSRVLPAPATLAARVAAAERAARLGKRGRKKKVVAVFCGVQEPWDCVWPQTLRAAAKARLPILFVFEAEPKTEAFAPMAQEFGLPGITVDCQDVVAIYRVASEAIAHARRGNGPTLIECKPWVVAGSGRRMGASGGALRTMEKYLASKGLFRRQFKAETVSRFERELDEAVAAARSGARKTPARKPASR